jgi:hypothetical protein
MAVIKVHRITLGSSYSIIGTQTVNGNLAFTANTTVKLGSSTYTSAGTYVIFDVTGTITGLTLVGGLYTLTIDASATGRTSSLPYLDPTGKKILINLT